MRADLPTPPSPRIVMVMRLGVGGGLVIVDGVLWDGMERYGLQKWEGFGCGRLMG